MRKFRIAVATQGQGGLEDVVSDVFCRANTFTIVEVDGNDIRNVEVLQNPAVTYKHGAGPIVVKMLVDSDVNLVVAAKFGPGASALLKQHNVATFIIQAGMNVKKSIRKALTK